MSNPDRRCSVPGCPSQRRAEGLCNWHAVEKEWGHKWADLCHPNSPHAGKGPVNAQQK